MFGSDQLPSPAQKPMRLFQMFADEPANSSTSASPTKNRSSHPFERTTSSPEKSYNQNELLSYISPFSPYLESQSSNGEDSHSITDRYIPSGKLLKKDSLYQEE